MQGVKKFAGIFLKKGRVINMLWEQVLKFKMPIPDIVGYWNNRRNDYPHLKFPPEENTANYDIDMVSDYLDNCPVIRGYRGPSRCRICNEIIGSKEKSDGVYAWPEGLSHYTRVHKIKLPEYFIDNIKKGKKDNPFMNLMSKARKDMQERIALSMRFEVNESPPDWIAWLNEHGRDL